MNISHTNVVKPCAPHFVILSNAKNLFRIFGFFYEILHFVQDDRKGKTSIYAHSAL